MTLPINLELPPEDKLPVPLKIIDAIREVLSINGGSNDKRIERRRQARKVLRVWLSDIGCAQPTPLPTQPKRPIIVRHKDGSMTVED